MNALVSTIALVLLATASAVSAQTKDPVDYVDTRIGTISHMLVPTFPSIQRPNGMLRIVPPNESFTTDRINGFNLSVPPHRQGAVFRLMPASGDATALRPDWSSRYDHSTALPYRYSVFLDDHENNAWTYLWEVYHDVPGLIDLLGGRRAFTVSPARLKGMPRCSARLWWMDG